MDRFKLSCIKEGMKKIIGNEKPRIPIKNKDCLKFGLVIHKKANNERQIKEMFIKTAEYSFQSKIFTINP